MISSSLSADASAAWVALALAAALVIAGVRQARRTVRWFRGWRARRTAPAREKCDLGDWEKRALAELEVTWRSKQEAVR